MSQYNVTTAQLQALQQKLAAHMPGPAPTYAMGVPNEKASIDASSSDFIVRLNDIVDILDETPPTQAQWNKMREKIQEQVGQIVAARIRKAAQPYDQYTAGADLMKAQAQIQSYQAQLATAAMSATNYSNSVSWSGETEET